jgi:hypothetical protein
MSRRNLTVCGETLWRGSSDSTMISIRQANHSLPATLPLCRVKWLDGESCPFVSYCQKTLLYRFIPPTTVPASTSQPSQTWVFPPYHLRVAERPSSRRSFLPSQKLRELLSRLPNIPAGDDVVSLVGRIRLVPRDLLGYLPRDSGTFHVANSRTTEILK